MTTGAVEVGDRWRAQAETTAMDGIHDCGGKHGFGALAKMPVLDAFAGRHEAVVFAMVQALSGRAWANTDQFRHGVERVDPVRYLADGYYGRWLAGMELLLAEAGMLSPGDVAARLTQLLDDQASATTGPTGGTGQPVAPAPTVAAPTQTGAARRLAPASGLRGTQREVTTAPRFAVGESILTLRHGRATHTRLPAYARGARGRVVQHHGGWVLPDTNAHGLGEQPEHLYCVAFSGAELFGATDEPSHEVRLDLFESYLLPDRADYEEKP